MNMKKFIIIIISVALAGILALLGILTLMNSNGGNDFDSGSKTYKATAEDKKDLSLLADDYITRVGNFGVQFQEELDDEKRMEHLESIRLSQRQPLPADFIDRSAAYNSSVELLSTNSNLRFTTEEINNLSLNSDLTNFRSYETLIKNIQVNNTGIFININDSSYPALIVSLDVENTVAERVFYSPEREGESDGNIFIEEYLIDEKSVIKNQKIDLTFVNDSKGGWKVYDVREIADDRPIAAKKATESEIQSLFETSEAETFTLSTSSKDHYH